MRFIIGCLALIGIGVVLVIGGCLGMIGFGIASMPKAPDYATHSYIEKEYAADLKLIDKAIAADAIPKLAATVSADVVAIYLKDQELLKRNAVQSKSYSTMNGVGAGSIRTNTQTINCLVFQMSNAGTDYEVFLLDHGPPAGAPAKNAK